MEIDEMGMNKTVNAWTEWELKKWQLPILYIRPMYALYCGPYTCIELLQRKQLRPISTNFSQIYF